MANFIKNNYKVWNKSLIFYGFLVAYAVFAIYLSIELNVWEDETYSLHTSSNSLPIVISQSYNFEGQPPVYFVLLALWRLINPGIFFARIFSLLLIAFSAIIFYRLVRLISGNDSSRWLVIIFLLNPFTLWAALEIRTYALLIFLSSASIYYFFRYYIDNKIKYLYFFLAICIIGIYTQYFFAFLVFALAFSILLLKGWKMFFKICLYLIPVVLVFLPNLFFVNNQLALSQSQKFDYSIFSRLSAVLHTPQDFMLALNIVPFGLVTRWVIKTIFAALMIYAYFKLFKKFKVQGNTHLERINLILISISVLIILYSAAVAITSVRYNNKYMAIVFPLFMLLFSIFKIHSSIYRKLIFGIISLYFAVVLALNYKYPIKYYDFKSIAKYIVKIQRPYEPILFFSKVLMPPFSYYYYGHNPLIPLPSLTYDHNYYQNNINDTSQLRKSIEKIYTASKSYLLITDSLSRSLYDLKMDKKMVDACLNAHYKVTLDTNSFGENNNKKLRIRRLEKR